MQDPYTTLGVSRSASADEIKRAYRKLAHEHHPDKKHGNEAKFKDINEAYQILGDAKKKEQFDRFGSAGPQSGFGGAQGFQDFNFDFGGGGFESIFDMFGGGGAGASARQQKGEDLHLQVSVAKADLGKRKTYEFEAMGTCGDCAGTGAEGGKTRQCSDCAGEGRVRQAVRTPLGTFAQVVVCRVCGGDGTVAAAKCRSCNGGGRVKSKRTLEVQIPKELSDRHLIAFPLEGNAGPKGVPAGDLLVTLRMK
jgi:molecular chaperone DnaJ